ncbi:MAG: hypothetical protein Q9214_005975 [Letrouitia sp. 1 TL-2023]
MAEQVEPRCRLRSPQHRVAHVSSSEFPAHPHRISFLHPCYKRYQNTLFFMYAFDSPNGGLHHATARTACAIVAGNRWDGFLSLTPTGRAIEVADEALLMDNEYYFLVPGVFHQPSSSKRKDSVMLIILCRQGPLSASEDTAPSTSTPSRLSALPDVGLPYMYPIVPGFKQWTFPHNHLPDAWEQVEIEASGSNCSDAVALRDTSCRMTAYEEECDNSHLCPLSEAQ